MLYSEDTKLRRRGEVCIGGRDVIYTRYNAKSLAKPLTRLPVQVTRYSTIIPVIVHLNFYPINF